MLNTLINIILVIGILGVLIFIHELGHFIAARLCKVRVDEFAIGLGPKLFSFRRGETEYRLNILPIGGYVKILGEGDEVVGKKDTKDPRNLKNKSKAAQIFVMLAGITMNLFLAASIYFYFISSTNYRWALQPDFVDFNPWFGETVVEKKGELLYTGLVEDMNAQRAGLPKEGEIISFNGEAVSYSYEFIDLLSENAGKDIALEICNDECSTHNVEVSDVGTIGIYLPHNYEVYISYEKTGVFSGLAHSANIVQLIGERFSEMFSSAKRTGDYSEITTSVSGPVGMYVIIDYLKSYGWPVLLGLTADFSLTLAVFNALPIPALDGGRVFLILVEAIIRKPLNEKLKAVIINVSFLMLLALMIAIIFKDIFTIDQLRSLLK